MSHMKIYPAKESALNISHPIDGPCRPDGAHWTYDGFTCRCLTDGAITDDPAKAWKSPAQVEADADAK